MKEAPPRRRQRHVARRRDVPDVREVREPVVARQDREPERVPQPDRAADADQRARRERERPARHPAGGGAVVGAVTCTLLAVGLVVYVLSRPPSVLLITIDTLRPDRLGCYGHPTNATPAIDRLAREGMLFEHAYCDIPWTTGSMSSVMTGQ